jgi:hypothetical protein
MAGKNTAVFGIYPDRSSVENAVDMLKAEGYRNTDISVLFPENMGTKDFAHQKATKAPEGATAGAGTGAVVGGTLGWLAGIGAIAIPGIGPLIAAGPIVAALAGAGAGGAVGGLTGALVGMGIPEYEAKRYAGRVRDGGILLSVHSDNSDWTKKAKELLERTGARDISSAGEAGADFAETDRPMPRGVATSGMGRSEMGRSETGRSMADYDSEYRRDFETRYTGRGYRYEQYAPAYQYGATCATDARYQNRDWQAIEPDVRRDWEDRGSGRWEDFKDSIRYGWERARGRKAA